MLRISGLTATLVGRALYVPVKWVLRMLGLLPGPVVATRGDITWAFDLDEAIDLGLWALNVFEPGVTRALARLLEPGHLVLDIGANVGAHTLRLAQRVGDAGVVYAFEPTIFGFEKLRRNLALNPSLSSRVRPLRVGLTDLAERPLPPRVSASWSLTRPLSELHPRDLGVASSTEGARFLALDRWVTDQGLARIDLVKLDVDGFEVRVLRGALESLRRFQPVIVMEWAPHHFVDPHEPFVDCIVLLQGLGYAFQSLDGAPIEGTPSELAASVPSETLVNVVAVPPAHHARARG